MEMWTSTVASPRRSAEFAARAEAAGWDGMLVVDSQNLSGDAYVALTMAATSTSTLGLATGVTNTVTRHPAVTACAIASVQKVSNNRAYLGIGRGDSALAHLGRAPARLQGFENYLRSVQAYLRGEDVPFQDCMIDDAIAPPVAALDLSDAPQSSAIGWLAASRNDRAQDLPQNDSIKATEKVPLEVAATGPKVIAIAARHAERIMFTVGAHPERLQWGIDLARAAASAAGRDPASLAFGAYINLACHPDKDTAVELARTGSALFARFSVMHGSTSGPLDEGSEAVLNELINQYDMNQHARVGSHHAGTLTAEFIDQFAVTGTPEACLERLEGLAALGLDKLAINGPGFTARAADARTAAQLIEQEILPNVLPNTLPNA